MNLEEFDNKLAEAFRNENLPPKDKLWENIATNIDKSNKTPIWWWAVPSLIIIAIAITFNSINAPKEDLVNNDKSEITIQEIKKENNTNQITDNTNKDNINSVKSTSDEQNITVNKLSENNISKLEEAKIDKLVKNQKSNPKIKDDIKNQKSNLNSDNISNQSSNSSSYYDEDFFKFIGFPFKKMKSKSFVFEDITPLELPTIEKKIKKPNDIIFINKNNKVVDFNKKWWFSYGIGPNLSINTLDIDKSKEKFVHKDLWEDKETLTRNGSGLNAFTHLSYNFKPLLSFETGLSYVMRVEPIRLSDESLDIPVRDITTNEITGYNKIIIYLLEKNQTTGLYDTIGSYQLASAHNLAVNNRYNAFTVPLTFNKEFVLSSNTKIKLGAGTGITYLYSNKASYLDYITTSKVDFKKKSMLNASFNANFGFYTNFNNVGEIGIYTGCNYYVKPWELTNKQYSLKMRDLNFGISFRRPLNWGN